MRTVYHAMSPCVRSTVDAVCAIYGVHATKIHRRGRMSRITRARDVVLYVCRSELGMSWAEIAEELRMRDASVIEAVERVVKLIEAGDAFTLLGLEAGEAAAGKYNGAGESAAAAE